MRVRGDYLSMTEQNVMGFIEEWQTGTFLIIGSALVGAVSGSLLGSIGSGNLGLVGFLVGAILAFLSISYLLYGH